MAKKTLERRTRYCGKVTAKHIGKEVTLCGWVASHRDHGDTAFVDLRDHTGIVQIVFEAGFGKYLSPEQIVLIRGKVRKRPAGTANPLLPTGELEVLAQRYRLPSSVNISGLQPEKIKRLGRILKNINTLERLFKNFKSLESPSKNFKSLENLSKKTNKTLKSLSEDIKTLKSLSQNFKTPERLSEDIKIPEILSGDIKIPEILSENTRTLERLSESFKSLEKLSEDFKISKILSENTRILESLSKSLKSLEKLSEDFKTPVFRPDDKEISEEARLIHRILYLRSRNMQNNLRLRHRMLKAIRKTLEKKNFLEVETPILTLATPEGARDFLVPSRTQQSSFYALPQSPQLFKQMLMAGGIDRYYQVARCFRDEDLRAGRQPEFTQIDLEMSFITAEDVMKAGESMVRAAFKAAKLELVDREKKKKVPQIKYDDAMRRFGSDAPHMGLDLELVEIKDAVQGCGFKVFANPASQDGSRVVALPVPGGAKLSRKQIDELTEFAQKLGAGGLAWMKIDEPGRGVAGVSSPIAKFLGDKVIDDITELTKAKAGTVLFFGAGEKKTVNGYMGPVRVRLGEIMKIIKEGLWPVWITEFPLFEYDASADELHSMHHPFTSPLHHEQFAHWLDKETLKDIKSNAYDLVVNGIEIGGGSIRIHDPIMQIQALQSLGIDEKEAERKFGFLLKTLRVGAPPHGGLAFGFDRMVAMAAGTESIRDVIAFPKTQSGQCPLTKAPQPAEAEQLRELGLRTAKPKKTD